jgi:argininosuccinate lyase
VRGKTGRVNGHLVALLTLMKGQPLAYNKDNQEDKEPLFDTADTLIDTLSIYADMIGGIRAKPHNMRAALAQGHATATDLADYLVKKGLPFRDAHEAVALAVRAAEERGLDLSCLNFNELRTALAQMPGAAERLAEDALAAISIEGSLCARVHIGGTAPDAVRAAITRARTELDKQKDT